MPERRSGKSPYQSKFGGGWISKSQYLAEIICVRVAGETDLPSRFWMNEPWKKVYYLQIQYANRLLKTFSVDAIMKALASPRGKNVKSLGAPFFRPFVEIEQRKLELAQKALELAPLPEKVNTLETPRPIKRAGKSIREKLAQNGPTERGLFDSEVKDE